MAWFAKIHDISTSYKMITYLNLRLSEMLPARNIVSIMFKATRHMLKEFFIFGWMRMYPARLLRKIPMMATTVLVTPSSQKAVSLIQYFSVWVWFGQSKVNLLLFVKLVTFVNSIESKRSRLKELVEFIVSFREVECRMRDQRPLSCYHLLEPVCLSESWWREKLKEWVS